MRRGPWPLLLIPNIRSTTALESGFWHSLLLFSPPDSPQQHFDLPNSTPRAPIMLLCRTLVLLVCHIVLWRHVEHSLGTRRSCMIHFSLKTCSGFANCYTASPRAFQDSSSVGLVSRRSNGSVSFKISSQFFFFVVLPPTNRAKRLERRIVLRHKVSLANVEEETVDDDDDDVEKDGRFQATITTTTTAAAAAAVRLLLLLLLWLLASAFEFNDESAVIRGTSREIVVSVVPVVPVVPVVIVVEAALIAAYYLRKKLSPCDFMLLQPQRHGLLASSCIRAVVVDTSRRCCRSRSQPLCCSRRQQLLYHTLLDNIIYYIATIRY
jgi:hypothetical protein